MGRPFVFVPIRPAAEPLPGSPAAVAGDRGSYGGSYPLRCIALMSSALGVLPPMPHSPLAIS